MEITTTVKLKKPTQFSQIEICDSWSDNNDESMKERKKFITDNETGEFLNRVKEAFKNQINDLEMSDLIIKQ
jgi:hypothetical protein